jgi:hypothetical protein
MTENEFRILKPDQNVRWINPKRFDQHYGKIGVIESLDKKKLLYATHDEVWVRLSPYVLLMARKEDIESVNP